MASYNNEKYFEALRLKAEARSIRRKEDAERRTGDAERKRQERAAMSPEQKEAVKEKARHQYHNKKVKYAAKKANTSAGDDEHDDGIVLTISTTTASTTAVNLADDDDVKHVSTTPTTKTLTAEEEVAATLVMAAVAEPSYAGTNNVVRTYVCNSLCWLLLLSSSSYVIQRHTFIIHTFNACKQIYIVVILPNNINIRPYNNLSL